MIIEYKFSEENYLKMLWCCFSFSKRDKINLLTFGLSGLLSVIMLSFTKLSDNLYFILILVLILSCVYYIFVIFRILVWKKMQKNATSHQFEEVRKIDVNDTYLITDIDKIQYQVFYSDIQQLRINNNGFMI